MTDMTGTTSTSRFRIPALPPAALLPVLVLLGLASAGIQLSTGSELVLPVLGRGPTITSIVVVTVGVLSLIAAVEGSTALRRALAATLLLSFAATVLARLGGASHPTWFGPHPAWHQVEPGLCWGLLIATALALGGLLARRLWGRWLAVGLAATGVLHAGFDLLQSTSSPAASVWLSSVQAAGCVLLLGNLAAQETAEADDLSPKDELWASPLQIVSWLRAAVVSAFVAIPMLLAYAWVQPGRATSLGGWDIVIATALGVGATATLRGKTWGALLLVLSGFGLLALTLELARAGTTAFDRQLATYYAAFWLPAAACSLAAGVSLTRTLRASSDSEGDGNST
jgi:hypothetical protein